MRLTMPLTLRLHTVAVRLCLAAVLAAGAAQAQPLVTDAQAWRAAQAQAEHWVDEGHDLPEQVLAQLAVAQPAPEGVPEPAWRRLRLRSQGLVAARAGRLTQAQDVAAELARWQGPEQAAAQLDAQVLAAVLAEQQWQITEAEALAARAEQALSSLCGQRPGESASEPAIDCDPLLWWRMARLRAGHAESRGRLVEARDWQQQALQAAQRAGAPRAQAWSLSSLAVLNLALDEPETAREQQAQAERLAQREPLGDVLVRVRINEARQADLRGDATAALQAMESALALVRPLQRPRLQAVVLANLSDLWRRAGRLREALAAAEQALPVLRRFADRQLEAPLLFNGGLVRLALGQGRVARSELDAALALWTQADAHGPLRQALRQYADALAQAGDARAALALMARERALGEQLEQATRDAVLATLRQSQQRERERSDFEQLSRDNALKAAELANQQWAQRTRIVAGALLLAVAAMLGWLVWRNRQANQLLRAHAERLRAQNRADPLTGLANRRHGREWLAAWRARSGRLSGGLMLLDVDHFKRINDLQGHHAGDLVLAEVARRLAARVPDEGLVCRWGGEEFLVAVPGLGGAELDTLAQRLLSVVGDAPVPLPGGRALPVTLSIGLAAWPLAGEPEPLTVDTALERVDLALYAAKTQGRDRAVRLQAVLAEGPAQRALLSGAFAQAGAQGLVRLATLRRHG